MTDIQLFNFKENEVRVVMIDDVPWFVAKDVASVFEYTEPARMLQLVDEDDKCVINPQKLDSAKMVESFSSNTFRLSIINESGVYAVIFGSTKPEAKAFKKWVTSEVLPTIRKTGSYHHKPLSQIEILIGCAQEIHKLQQEQERLKLEQQLQSQELKELKQLTHQHDAEIDRIFNPNGRYYSIMGYFNAHNLGSISTARASVLGRKATALCKEYGIEITQVRDPRFGNINTYPEDVIAQVLG